MNRHNKSSIREKVVQNLELPQDLMLGASVVTITGRREILIENYRGIILLEESIIKIQTKSERITISGSRLSVAYYTSEEMKIFGFIDSIQYDYG